MARSKDVDAREFLMLNRKKDREDFMRKIGLTRCEAMLLKLESLLHDKGIRLAIGMDRRTRKYRQTLFIRNNARKAIKTLKPYLEFLRKDKKFPLFEKYGIAAPVIFLGSMRESFLEFIQKRFPEGFPDDLSLSSSAEDLLLWASQNLTWGEDEELGRIFSSEEIVFICEVIRLGGTLSEEELKILLAP